MSRIDVIVDMSGFERMLTALEKQQLPFARSLAANEAAFGTMQTMRRVMPSFVQAPTPFTVRAVLYRKGNKAMPAAEVYLTGDAAKGTPPSKYLTITRGGPRGQRRSERVLTRAGLITQGEGWVPGKWLKANRYGNQLTGARLTQILSAIGAFGEQGFSANATAASRARKPGRTEYFVSRGGRLARGIWERYGSRGAAAHKYKDRPSGRSKVQRGIRPVMLFVPLPSYGKTFDFVHIASTEARRRYVRAWPAAFKRAMSSARRR